MFSSVEVVSGNIAVVSTFNGAIVPSSVELGTTNAISPAAVKPDPAPIETPVDAVLRSLAASKKFVYIQLAANDLASSKSLEFVFNSLDVKSLSAVPSPIRSTVPSTLIFTLPLAPFALKIVPCAGVVKFIVVPSVDKITLVSVNPSTNSCALTPPVAVRFTIVFSVG